MEISFKNSLLLHSRNNRTVNTLHFKTFNRYKINGGNHITSLIFLYYGSKQMPTLNPIVTTFEEQFGWGIYWVILGVLSSVGLGTGLHTFLLYLGPHIAKVTMAAYECGTTD